MERQTTFANEVQVRGLLFINGTPPKNLPKTEGYDVIACTDGAFHYLKEKNFPLEKLDFISGDFDSHEGNDENIYQEKFIVTPDQDFTDFQKALEILKNKGVKKVDVYGGSGGEQDHFLGNLHVAFLFKNELKIIFFDEFSTYFFVDQNFELDNVLGKTISILPFPKVEYLTTEGLFWELKNENLDITTRISTRNKAISNKISIQYKRGALLIFVSNR